MELGRVRKKPTYLSFLNFLVFCLFFAAMCLFTFNPAQAQSWGLGKPELEMIMLQAVSFLMVVCAIQLPPKAAKGWRPALLTFAFVALSESSLVALLTPVG